MYIHSHRSPVLCSVYSSFSPLLAHLIYQSTGACPVGDCTDGGCASHLCHALLLTQRSIYWCCLSHMQPPILIHALNSNLVFSALAHFLPDRIRQLRYSISHEERQERWLSGQFPAPSWYLRPQFQGCYIPSFDLQEYGMHVAHKHVDKTLTHKIKNKQILKKSRLSVGKEFNRSSGRSLTRGTLSVNSFTSE